MTDHDDNDADLDNAAGDNDEVHATSVSRMTREFDDQKNRQKAAAKKAWKDKPIRTAFSKVVAPSGLLASAAYGLSHAFGEPSIPLAAISGALWTPIHTVREPIARFAGKVDGSIRNLSSTFDKASSETYFQQKTQEIRYEGFSDGFVTTALATGAVMLPTYGDIIVNTATSIGDGLSYVTNVIVEGVQAVSGNSSPIDPSTGPQ